MDQELRPSGYGRWRTVKVWSFRSVAETGRNESMSTVNCQLALVLPSTLQPCNTSCGFGTIKQSSSEPQEYTQAFSFAPDRLSDAVGFSNSLVLAAAASLSYIPAILRPPNASRGDPNSDCQPQETDVFCREISSKKLRYTIFVSLSFLYKPFRTFISTSRRSRSSVVTTGHWTPSSSPAPW